MANRDKLFMTKENRDKQAQAWKAQGYAVRKYSVRNQNLHPMYVEDYPYPLSAEDKGFGNTLYQTIFDRLFGAEIIA